MIIFVRIISDIGFILVILISFYCVQDYFHLFGLLILCKRMHNNPTNLIIRITIIIYLRTESAAMLTAIFYSINNFLFSLLADIQYNYGWQGHFSFALS